MKSRPTADEETPEQAAGSIGAALDFLRAEAQAAGLSGVADLIQRASVEAKEKSATGSTAASDGRRLELVEACKAIVGLPDEYREALIFRKVYRRSYEEIARDCGVSVDIAKERVMRGFQLVRRATTTRPG